MKKRKAFTLPEIIIVVVLVTAILGVVYKLFSGALNQLFKSSNKMTNLRAASIILEKLKNDIRCSVATYDKNNDQEKPLVDNDHGKLRFLTTSVENGKTADDVLKERPRMVEYSLEGDKLTRTSDGNSRQINSAKVASFSIVPDQPCSSMEELIEKCNFITVYIAVDTEKDATTRSLNTKNNQIVLKAKLFPRFLEKTQTDEDRAWYESRSLQNAAVVEP